MLLQEQLYLEEFSFGLMNDPFLGNLWFAAQLAGVWLVFNRHSLLHCVEASDVDDAWLQRRTP